MDRYSKAVVGLSLSVFLILTFPLLLFNFPFLIGAEGAYIVQTNSMEPAIPTESLVIVYRKDPAQIEDGDVITFWAKVEGGTVRITHRVTEVSDFNGEYNFLTQGDANRNPDPTWVPEENVIGTVEVVIPGFGEIVENYRRDRWIIFLVAVPAILLILNEILEVWKTETGFQTIIQD